MRPGRRKGHYGTAFLLQMDHISSDDPRGAAGVASAGLSLAKPSQDPSQDHLGSRGEGDTRDERSFNHRLSPAHPQAESRSGVPCAS